VRTGVGIIDLVGKGGDIPWVKFNEKSHWLTVSLFTAVREWNNLSAD